jgi:aminoglycoside phosphotransferase family enzyme/predicted kinase
MVNSGAPPRATLVTALRATLAAPVEILETHISWVLLSGDHAWKIKKPVDFGFLDFSTLEKRRFYCEEELRLNRRLAPEMYLAVIPISGSPDAPILDGDGPAIEYAVKMRRFPRNAQFDTLLAHDKLEAAHLDAVARKIAIFHQQALVAAPDSSFGTPEAVHLPVRQNFAQIHPLLDAPADLARLEALRVWSEAEFQRLAPFFAQRKEQGCVRECHGDLHLGNLAWFAGEAVPFDCLEFNENLRWVDVISEIAFLVMDLHDRQQPELAWRTLNVYLEEGGDYAGLAVLRYYLVYRALVRAKVAALSAARPTLGGEALARCRDYLALADAFISPAVPFLVITHGLSGSGKTTLSGQLAMRRGAIRLRSDIERKRLFGLDGMARSGSTLDGGIYTQQAHQQTYRKLEDLTCALIKAGWPVVVDAAFLRHVEREAFRTLAKRCTADFAILDLQVPTAVLRERIMARDKAGNDASEATLAVLEKQLIWDEPLDAEERRLAIAGDSPPQE